jgi:hypothetical protein
MLPSLHNDIEIDQDIAYKEKDRFEEELAQADPFG